MLVFLLAPLMTTLSPHFDLSKTRLETLTIMLAGLANGRTVNLSHLASQFPGMALHASSYRRLQRFFQHVRLDGDVVAQLIFRLLDLRGAQLLALDRTNWKLGKTDINIRELYLKVTFGGSFTILFWSARHSWIEKRLTYVFFRHFWHVEFPFHFGLCRLVVRISKLFGCGLGFCVCHFAAFVR